MDESYLRRLSRQGFTGVSAERLSDVADWCWDWCEATGDGRYCSLAQTFWTVDAWWSEHSMVPDSLVMEIERLFMSHLDSILDAEESAAGSHQARLLRESIMAVLLPPAEWAPEP